MTVDPIPPTNNTPRIVTLVAILALITGLFSWLAGVILIWGGVTDPASLGQPLGVSVLQGVIYLIIGSAAMAVFRGLLSGQHWARVLFTVVLVAAALSDLVNILLGHNVSGSLWGIVLDVVCLILLWGAQTSRDFFEANRSH